MGRSTPLARESARLSSLLRQCGTPQRILDAGCGSCPDVGIIRRCFPHAAIFGVDFDLAPLQSAQRSNRDPALCLIQADLSRLPLHTTFDLILVRHPDLHRRTASWERSFIAVITLLAPTGLLLTTTYTADEQALISAWLTPLRSVPLELAQLAPLGLAGRDRHALLFQAYPSK